MSKQFEESVYKIATVLSEKKAEDIVLIDVSEATILAETFVICNGGSPNQVKMLAEEVEKVMTQEGMLVRRIEGASQGRWIVLDFGHILVHIFHREEREFYDIERLWKGEENFVNYTDDAAL